jgi:sugar phosphate isomerase/epimerase
MKKFMILTGLAICGCSSQPTELTQEARDIHLFYEEPVMRNAAELGADGVIVHSISSRGSTVGSTDTFGIGGREVNEVFHIQATAIRYVE